MSQASPLTPKHERLIAFAPSDDGGDGAESPVLAINAEAIASVELCNRGTCIRIHLTSGVEHRIDGLLRPRARALLRDILSRLGGKTSVPIPPDAQITSERHA